MSISVYLSSLCVRTDVNSRNMEEIDNMQSIPDLERLIPVYDQTHLSVYVQSHTRSTDFFFLPYLFSSVTVLCAVCLKLTFLHQKEEFCWSYTSRLCFFAESAISKRNKPLLSCPSLSRSMRLILVSKSDYHHCHVVSCLRFNLIWMICVYCEYRVL